MNIEYKATVLDIETRIHEEMKKPINLLGRGTTMYSISLKFFPASNIFHVIKNKEILLETTDSQNALDCYYKNDRF